VGKNVAPRHKTSIKKAFYLLKRGENHFYAMA